MAGLPVAASGAQAHGSSPSAARAQALASSREFGGPPREGSDDPDRGFGLEGISAASAGRHPAHDRGDLFQRNAHRARRRCCREVGLWALDIGGRLAQSGVEPHIGRRNIGEPRFADPSRRQRAQTAVDAADEMRMSFPLSRLQRAKAVGRVGSEEVRELRLRARQTPARQMKSVSPRELG